MPADSLPQARDRRADLLKVADLFYSAFRLRSSSHYDLNPDGSFGEEISSVVGIECPMGPRAILQALDETGEDWDDEEELHIWSSSQWEYAKSLLNELPAFLKAEWERYRHVEEQLRARTELE